MIWPHPRLLWLLALVAVPACTLGGALPAFTLPCAAILGVGLIFITFDAAALLRQAESWQVRGDAKLQWFKSRAGTITLDLESKGAADLLVYLELPPELCTAESVIKAQFRGMGRVEVVCLPEQRGCYELTNCFLSGVSPLKLWQVKVKRSVAVEIRVYPDLQRDAAARMLMLRQWGARRLRLVGRGRDFERLRDYTPGDSFDEIYWKSTARHGFPIVKVFQVERTQDIYVIIDSSRLSARHNALEQFISSALTVALATENEGDNFGLVTFSDRVDHFIRAGKGKAHFSRCRDAIYDLSAKSVSPDFQDLFASLQLQIRKRSLLLFLTDLSDAMLAEAFQRDAQLLARKHLMIVHQLEDEESRPLFSGAVPANVEEIDGRLAGHLQWAKLQDLGRSLRRIGIGMYFLKTGSASADLVGHYLEAKQRQAL